MKLSRNMTWATPFVESVSDLVPLSRVTVKGYTVPLHLCEHHLGQCDTKGRKSTITIRLSDNDYATRRQHAQVLEDVLVTLAHELAHIVHYDHSPAHLKLTARILQRFATVAKRQGVKDTSRRLVRKEAA